jgi:tRNA modification GTPase
MKEDVIVSISTPLGKGAVAIVRMSGKGCLDIALKFFHNAKLTKENIVPRYMYFGKIELEENVFEECLMVYFKAPFSYTGEDIVEFQIHGGVLVAQKILDVCIKNGACLAEPGEYSKRAFLNGKITLDKAEAIIGEINAETDGELKSSLQITNGKLANQISAEQEKLKYLLAEIEVGMDYPDETEELGLKLNIFERLKEIEAENLEILNQSKSAKYIKNGINVALVGKTNVGKSSVMNALLGEDRAIVTNIQGTTRDSITESFVYNGIKINLIDTAGIRETTDIVENIGIEKSKQNLNQADIVLFVIDGSEKETEEDKKIESLLKDKKFVTVINKTDKKRLVGKKENEIEISALANKNINLLKEKIIAMVIDGEVDANALVVTNERQYRILEDAHKQIEEILSQKTLPLDVIAMMIKKLWQTFGKITGNSENEDIINLIFSKFCLGK